MKRHKSGNVTFEVLEPVPLTMEEMVDQINNRPFYPLDWTEELKYLAQDPNPVIRLESYVLTNETA